MEELRVLKKQRSQLKGVITRHGNYLDKLGDASGNLWELMGRKDKLIQLWDDFNMVQLKIECLDENNSDHELEREEFENHYFDLMARTQEMLLKLEGVSNLGKQTGLPGRRENTEEKLRLPPIDLKQFSGNCEDWIPFFQLFKSMVHDNKELGDLQKFHYLRTSLVGKAADVISDLELVPENYEEAWNLLLERYNNRRLIIQKHVKAIFDSPSVNKENPVLLRNFLDHFKRHFRALKALNSDAVESSDLLIYFVLTKLDTTSVREWEDKQSRDNKATIEELLEFLMHRCETLEAIKSPSATNYQNPPGRRIQSANASTVTYNPRCPMCKENHAISQCEAFKGLSPNEKYKKILDKGLCMNCLKKGSHLAKDCFSMGCKICKEKHHSLLHERFSPSKAQNITSVNYVANAQMSNQIILSTVKVEIFDSSGRKHYCRALLDSGSQSDFITEHMVKKLNLKRERLSVSVVGIGQKTTQGFERVDVKIKSRIRTYYVNLKPLILERITEALPIHTFDKKLMEIPEGLILADPEFNISGEIDLLIGSQNFWNCLNEKRIQLKGQPKLQDTKFGWIVAGGWADSSGQRSTSINNFATISDDSMNLTKFWEIESILNPIQLTVEEKYCVTHYERTYKRDGEGRFIVELPVRQEKVSQLGDNREVALRRFYNLEAKLNKNPQLKNEYIKFMREYESLGHMEEIHENLNSGSVNYYLPHHCVLNENSLTTKLRVVFDASAKDKSSLSLNEVLMTGPVLQQDLFSLLVRFRSFKYVLTADIKKMYRQVKLAEHQTDLQKIFWRENTSSKIKTFRLLTVTYGTASASFLAIKSLQELAKLEGADFPLGAKIALRDFYVDDLITGANTKEELLMIRKEITALLGRGGMQLAKWCTNVSAVLAEVDPNSEKEISFDKDANFRTLGVKWWPTADELGYAVQGMVDNEGIVTKRKILSSIAKIFDPLGLVGPYIILAKILLQRLWELNLGWDDEAPESIQAQWNNCQTLIRSLQDVKFPRFVGAGVGEEIEIHGFCDASERAYGACIYVRSLKVNGTASSKLLCAKSRVSPIKTVSIPRLELCAAVLLTNLIQKVKASWNISAEKVYCWTDSKIVLSWIRSSSKKWSVFVAHRIGTIQESMPVESWRHVPSEENPADLLSRGCSKGGLESQPIWWQGPAWLQRSEKYWPKEISKLTDEEIPELKKVVKKVVVKGSLELFEKYSTYKRMVRIVAYLQRFINNCKLRKEEREFQRLNSHHLERAEMALLKRVQIDEYAEEINLLRKGQSVARGSKLVTLRPFLDENGLLRVGGRLQNADLPFLQKHPIIIPGKHPFTKLLLLQEHERLLHTGANTTLASIRERFWPTSVKSFLKNLIHNCVKCRKAAPIRSTYVMGSLPHDRTKYVKPFEISGVDYCGPFTIKESKRRKSKTNKIWVAVFICLSVKAVHLEICTDLTSEGFLHALKRFISRRGMVRKLYSDNATNFSGASKELHFIEWKFIPPRAPHFGGLWEAAVKAFKTHLKKAIGEQVLTFEEFNTLLISIEAILNSRPLIPLSDDINDFSCLTPAHFLIGDSLTSLSKFEKDDFAPINYNRRWQLVQMIREFFWRRWYTEYLRGCQVRAKWTTGGAPVSVGQLVMVLEDNTNGKGNLGRITEVFKGVDGIVRVVKVRTAAGEFKRPVKKIAPLPIPVASAEQKEQI